MRTRIRVEPGMTLVATALFLNRGPLFVSILGPAGVSFGSGWMCEVKEITNGSNQSWQLSIQASHGGPIGSEVPVWMLLQSGNITLVSVGAGAMPEALLLCAVVARG